MKTILAAIGTFAMLATSVLATATPASADGFYRGYGGRGWDGGGRHYRHHRGGGDALAAGVIGLGVGAIIGGALAGDRRGYYDEPGYYDGPRYYRARPQYRVLEGPVYYDQRPVVYERRVRYREVPTYRGRYNHVAACEARYRSYDRHSDTFVGYDGRIHRCRL